MFYAKRNSEFYIFGKSPRARPKPNIRKPGPARGPKKLGPARPKPGNFRPVTSLVNSTNATKYHFLVRRKTGLEITD